MINQPTAFAQLLWQQILSSGDRVIDATCGNGKDSFEIAKLIGPQGHLIAIDIQAAALERTQALLQTLPQLPLLSLFHQSHATMPDTILDASVQMIVYNLGYLPGGNKQLTTSTPSTLQSLSQSAPKLRPGGFFSIMCYPGHAEGAMETQALLHWASTLCKKTWICTRHEWVNRGASPLLLLIQKKIVYC